MFEVRVWVRVWVRVRVRFRVRFGVRVRVRIPSFRQITLKSKNRFCLSVSLNPAGQIASSFFSYTVTVAEQYDSLIIRRKTV